MATELIRLSAVDGDPEAADAQCQVRGFALNCSSQ
jgi:catalase